MQARLLARATVCFVVAALASAPTPLRAAVTYTVTAIGDFSDGEPTAINASGDVVGYKSVGGRWHALLWRGGVLTDLGTFGFSDALAFDINDAGLIALVVSTPTGLRNMLWDGQSLTDITAVAGYSRTAVTNTGDVAGAAAGPAPYVYSNGAVTILPSPPCGGWALDLNSNGIVVGTSCGGTVPVVWQNGLYQVLPSPPGQVANSAYRVNAGGQIAGLGSTLIHWLPDGQGGYTVEDLGRLPGTSACGSNGLNDGGTITGNCDSAAFVWDSVNGLRNLNDISVLPPGVLLESGHDINNAGVIVARGIVSGHFEGYVLTPSAENQPPTASAGPNQTVRPGTLVHLDGSGSSDDNTATAQLSYAWTFESTPSGSGVTLTGATTMTPSFVPDIFGTYVVRLVVTDQAGAASAPASVVIGQNTPPMVNAGLDDLVLVGHPVTLAGSATDAEHDALLTTWAFTSTPAGSTAGLNDVHLLSASFTPDRAGLFVLTLVAADVLGTGLPDEVIVAAITAPDYARARIVEAVSRLRDLADAAFTNNGNRNSLSQMLAHAATALEQGHAAMAAQKLQLAVGRLDGCAADGAPDGNGPGRDWLVTCEAQEQIHPLLQDALAALVP